MAAALETLAIGDRVVVKRILDPDTEVVEVVGTSTVMDRREIPAIAGSGSWPDLSLCADRTPARVAATYEAAAARHPSPHTS